MWFGFQFNLIDSSDDDLYRLDLDPEGQGFTCLPPAIRKRWVEMLGVSFHGWIRGVRAKPAKE